MGYPMEDLFLKKLSSAGYSIQGAHTPRDLTKVLPIVIQCFKASSLKYLFTKTNIPLVQLLGVSEEYPTPDVMLMFSFLSHNTTLLRVSLFSSSFTMKQSWTK
jgi:hypothetical protein